MRFVWILARHNKDGELEVAKKIYASKEEAEKALEVLPITTSGFGVQKFLLLPVDEGKDA